MAPFFSVAVPTYNRSAWLRNALESTVQLDFASDEYEVIVVDNNSTDDTEAVARSFVGQHPNIRYCREQQQGHCHARNRGWQEACGEYVAYIDDDCKVPPEWLSVAREIVRESAPVALGGPYYAFYLSPKPEWFKDAYGSHVQQRSARVLEQGEFLDGGNLFVQRQVLMDLGGFDPQFGMKGSGIGYQDETTVQTRIRNEVEGAVVYYDPRLYLYHLVRPEVMRPFWKLQSNYAHGKFGYRARLEETGSRQAARVSWRRAGRALAGLAWGLGPGILLRDLSAYPAWQNYVWEETSQHMKPLGNIVQYLTYRRAEH